LCVLQVEGETFLCDGLDVPKLRSLPRIALKTLGAPAALFLGCLLSGREHTIRMSNAVVCIALLPLTTRPSLSLAVTSAADLAVLLGSLACNPSVQHLTLPLSPCDRIRMKVVLDEMLSELGNAIRFCAPASPSCSPQASPAADAAPASPSYSPQPSP